jgi:hypothetical protein
MAYRPVPVPDTPIASIDVTNMGGGLFQGGDQNGPKNSFVDSKDAELDKYGFLIPRRGLIPFLPDTVETTYQKAPMLWNGQLYFFTLDDGKVKWCKEGDTAWTNCTGTNSFTTNNGGRPKLMRVLDNIFVLNGKNGDKLAYVNLSGTGFPVVKYTLVPNPTTGLTSALTNLTSGPYHTYYAYNYTGAVGQTELSPIIDITTNITRDQWQLQTAKGAAKLTFTDTPPAGARFRNLYIAIAATAGAIQPSDMLELAVKLDLSTTEFTDDGTLDINLGSVPPAANSTDGPRVSDGIIDDGNPILFRDEDNGYNIHIGGGGPNAMDLSISNGGYRAEPEKGTNYYPNAIVGFRTGQGVPALWILYSNTEGLSKQAILQQQTISYGDQSFTVWGVTEQHYGAAGVAAPYSAINYNGKLMFLSTDGFMSAQTAAALQNVMSFVPISNPIDDYVRSIKNSAMPSVVGAGWNNKYMWLIPNNGFDTPQQILVLDTNQNNKGIDGNGAWYTLDIPAQWIGVVSPETDAAFVYICQGTKTYKLVTAESTYDIKNGVPTPFSTSATGPLLGVHGEAHNTWMADVQAMFYIIGLIGEMTIGVRYRNQNGRLKTKTRKITGPTFQPSVTGGWGDPQWTYAGFDIIPGYGASPLIDDNGTSVTSLDVRKPVRIDEIHNEAQWFYITPPGFNKYKIKAISFEGVDLGVRPDLQ